MVMAVFATQIPEAPERPVSPAPAMPERIPAEPMPASMPPDPFGPNEPLPLREVPPPPVIVPEYDRPNADRWG